jgi:hypothetical protein
MSLGVYWDRNQIGRLQRVEERSREYFFQYTHPTQAISLSLPRPRRSAGSTAVSSTR